MGGVVSPLVVLIVLRNEAQEAAKWSASLRSNRVQLNQYLYGHPKPIPMLYEIDIFSHSLVKGDSVCMGKIFNILQKP